MTTTRTLAEIDADLCRALRRRKHLLYLDRSGRLDCQADLAAVDDLIADLHRGLAKARAATASR